MALYPSFFTLYIYSRSSCFISLLHTVTQRSLLFLRYVSSSLVFLQSHIPVSSQKYIDSLSQPVPCSWQTGTTIKLGRGLFPNWEVGPSPAYCPIRLPYLAGLSFLLLFALFSSSPLPLLKISTSTDHLPCRYLISIHPWIISPLLVTHLHCGSRYQTFSISSLVI